MKRIHVTAGDTAQGLTSLEVEGEEAPIVVSSRLLRLLDATGPGHLLWVGDGEVVWELGTGREPMLACIGGLVECTDQLVGVLEAHSVADGVAPAGLANLREQLTTIRVLLSYLREAAHE